ncbi:hypothetical protein E4U54_004690 [Claviceps lovelessii]|nr:hypothetical protein E4U54_004690 [Claviceps lovelessii]
MATPGQNSGDAQAAATDSRLQSSLAGAGVVGTARLGPAQPRTGQDRPDRTQVGRRWFKIQNVSPNPVQ